MSTRDQELVETAMEHMFDKVTYGVAKKAIKIWESEFVGQDSQKLWEYALAEAIRDASPQ